MTLVFSQKHGNLSLKSSYYLLAAMLFAFSFSGCDNAINQQDGYSSHFKKTLDTVNNIDDKNPAKGIKYLDSAFATINSPTVNDNFRRLSIHFLYSFKIKQNYKAALVCADSMINYINTNGGEKKYPSCFAEASFAKGDVFFALHDYNDAYRYYFYGYKIGKNHLDNNLLSAYSYRMGMITYQQSNYYTSVNFFKECYEQSLVYDKDFVVFFRNQEVLDNIALCYSHLEKTDSAITYFNKSLNYINTKGPAFLTKKNLLAVARAVINGNQADIYIKRGDYQNAIDLLQQSISINLKKEGDRSDGMLSEIKLARIYKEQNNQQLLSNLLDSINIQLQDIPANLMTIDLRKVEADWFLLKSNLYEKHNNLDLALRYNQHYNLLKDSISESIRRLKEMSVSDKFDNYDKENQIETLTRYNKLQKIYLRVSILAGVLALAITLMIYYNWRRSKKEISSINKLNNEVNNQKSDLQQTLNKLNESSREKDRILHTVAHDLRNPLGGIASLTNIMAEDDFNAQQLEYINLIKETADNSLQLINEIFEATNAGIGEIKLKQVEINSLVNNSVELLKFKGAEKNQQIIVKPLAEPEYIMASHEKLWRVISNILVNAIKFSPIRTDIVVEVTRTNTDIVVAITDQGIGIPDKIKPQIFNMFTEAKRMGTMGEKSFGLGLSICKQIIEKHGGKIWVEDNPKGGSIFYISLKRNVV